MFPFLWKPRQERSPSELRRSRFQSLLAAAIDTCYYRPLLEAAGISAPDATAVSGSIEEVLARLPRTRPSVILGNRSASRNRRAPKDPQRHLYFPLPQPSRTAVLMAGFRSSGAVRNFEDLDRRALARYRPDALAGPVTALRRLAEGAEDRGSWAPRLEHSVIAFHGPGRAFLSHEARELFWRVFQAPVFGQFIGLGGELLAWECEAHHGLHIERDNAVFELAGGEGEPELLVTSLVNLRQPALRLATDLTAEIEYSYCGCGRTAWLLTGLRRRRVSRAAKPARVVAGTACAAD